MISIADADWSALAELVSRSIPEAPDVRITNVVDLPGGWETEVVRLDFREDAGDSRGVMSRVIRIFPGPTGEERARHEYEVMSLVAARGLPLPAVDRLVVENSPLETPFILMEYVEGTPLREVLQGADHGMISASLARMGSILARLHALEIAADTSAPSTLLANWSEDQGDSPAELTSLRETVGRFELEGFGLLLERLETRFEPIRSLPPRLLHNDFHPDNILVREADHQYVVIDWSFANSGDPRSDLAWAAFLVGTMLGEPSRRHLLDGYAEMGGTIADLEAFEMLKLSSRLATLATWVQGQVPSPIPRITPRTMRGEYRVHILNVYNRYLDLGGNLLSIFEEL